MIAAVCLFSSFASCFYCFCFVWIVFLLEQSSITLKIEELEEQNLLVVPYYSGIGEHVKRSKHPLVLQMQAANSAARARCSLPKLQRRICSRT